MFYVDNMVLHNGGQYAIGTESKQGKQVSLTLILFLDLHSNVLSMCFNKRGTHWKEKQICAVHNQPMIIKAFTNKATN